MQAADIGDACLKAARLEKACFVAGPEFGEGAGHALAIYKALHGLRTSGARWGEKFTNTLRLEGFFPCCADPCVWIKMQETHGSTSVSIMQTIWLIV
jgi:hypothetical protein